MRKAFLTFSTLSGKTLRKRSSLTSFVDFDFPEGFDSESWEVLLDCINCILKVDSVFHSDESEFARGFRAFESEFELHDAMVIVLQPIQKDLVGLGKSSGRKTATTNTRRRGCCCLEDVQMNARNLSWLSNSGGNAIRRIELCYRGVKYFRWIG